MELPSYTEASRRRINCMANDLDRFITNWEPKLTDESPEVINVWREDLRMCLNEAICKCKPIMPDAEAWKLLKLLRWQGKVILWLAGGFVVSVIANLVTLFWR